MKIVVRPRLYSQELAQRIAADPALAKALGAQPNGPTMVLFKNFLDAQSPALWQVLEMGRGERLSYLWHMEFTGAEVAAAAHLEVRCRKTIGQTDADKRATMAAYDADTLHPTVPPWAVRLPQVLYLGKAPPPHAISHVDQWTGEFVLGTAAADALRASDLGGYELRPVLHHRTKAAQDFAVHLTTREILPPVLDGPNVFRRLENGPAQPPTPRRLGLLAYARGALDGTPDFARTCEPWCDWSTPQWVVRQRVRGWYTAAGLAGWDFWPVLEQGSALQHEHDERWAALRSRMAAAGAELAS